MTVATEVVHVNGASQDVPGFVLLLSGGGYARVGENEGPVISNWLANAGVPAGYLEYSVPPPSPERPLCDVLQALAALRAGQYGPVHGPIAVMGSSAGGHLAGLAATATSRELEQLGSGGQRPDLAVFCYPVVSLVDHPHLGSRKLLLGGDADSHSMALRYSVDHRVDAATPPSFVWHTADDPVVPVENSLALASSLHRAGVDVDLHVYSHGRHGLALDLDGEAPWTHSWRDLLLDWLHRHGIGRHTSGSQQPPNRGI